jgi:hypothetical protein
MCSISSSGLKKLHTLNLGWCSAVEDYDIMSLQSMTSLTDVRISRTKVTDIGVNHLKGGVKSYFLLTSTL